MADRASDRQGYPLTDRHGNVVSAADVHGFRNEPLYDWRGRRYRGDVYHGGRLVRHGSSNGSSLSAGSGGDAVAGAAAFIVFVLLGGALLLLLNAVASYFSLFFKRMRQGQWIGALLMILVPAFLCAVLAPAAFVAAVPPEARAQIMVGLNRLFQPETLRAAGNAAVRATQPTDPPAISRPTATVAAPISRPLEPAAAGPPDTAGEPPSAFDPGTSPGEPAAGASRPHVRVIVNAAYVRDGPGMAYPVLDTLPGETSCPVLAGDAARSWYNIELEDGRRAWIGSTVVELTSSADSVPVAATIPAPPQAAAP